LALTSAFVDAYFNRMETACPDCGEKITHGESAIGADRPCPKCGAQVYIAKTFPAGIKRLAATIAVSVASVALLALAHWATGDVLIAAIVFAIVIFAAGIVCAWIAFPFAAIAILHGSKKLRGKK
jgi:endogenous inhibitor of DNA gyrase (YacG/DUF329 family)